MNKVNYNITVGGKNHAYSLVAKGRGKIFVECKDAKIAQEFLAEDVSTLLLNLPNLLIAEKEYKKRQSEIVRFRISPKDKARIEQKAIKSGYQTVSDYMRYLTLQ